MNTSNLNFIDNSGRIYCHRMAKILKPTPAHFENQCEKCPYFAGTAGSRGAECVYDNGSNEESMTWRDAGEAEYYARQQMVKMGVMTEEEAVDGMTAAHESGTEELLESEVDSEDLEDSLEGVTIVTEGE